MAGAQGIRRARVAAMPQGPEGEDLWQQGGGHKAAPLAPMRSK
jgi:hypothetical protein